MTRRHSLSRWLGTSPLLSGPRRATWRAINWLLEQRDMTAVPITECDHRNGEYALIRQVGAETDMLLLRDEAYQLLSCARETAKVKGAIAEVGVYRGASARLICEVRQERELYLFDTFEGLPQTDASDRRFTTGQYAAAFETVQNYLAGYPRLHIYKGYFPDTSGPIEGKQFSFVHLDVDLYEPIFRSLEFFYPRVSPGGIILIHDYLWGEGVRKAVQEFFNARPEPILDLAGTYCGIVKL